MAQAKGKIPQHSLKPQMRSCSSSTTSFAEPTGSEGHLIRSHRRPAQATLSGIDCKPDDVLLFRLRIGLWRVFGEAVGRNQAAVLRLQLRSPVGRRCIASVGDRRPRRLRWGRHSPAHHRQFAFCAGVTNHRSRIVGEHTRHWRQVADIPVQHPEKSNDGGLICGDAVEIAH
jgi:hypothetical protein